MCRCAGDEWWYFILYSFNTILRVLLYLVSALRNPPPHVRQPQLQSLISAPLDHRHYHPIHPSTAAAKSLSLVPPAAARAYERSYLTNYAEVTLHLPYTTYRYSEEAKADYMLGTFRILVSKFSTAFAFPANPHPLPPHTHTHIHTHTAHARTSTHLIPMNPLHSNGRLQHQ